MKSIKEFLNFNLYKANKISEGLLPSNKAVKVDFLKKYITGYKKYNEQTNTVIADKSITFKNLTEQQLTIICNDYNFIHTETTGNYYTPNLNVTFENCFISVDALSKLFELKDFGNFKEEESHKIRKISLILKDCKFEGGLLDLSDFVDINIELLLIQSGNIKLLKGPGEEKSSYTIKPLYNVHISDCSSLSEICNIHTRTLHITDCPTLNTTTHCGATVITFNNIGIKELKFDNKMFEIASSYNTVFNIQLENCNSLIRSDIPFCERSYVLVNGCRRLYELNFQEFNVRKLSGMECNLYLTNNPNLGKVTNLPKFGITGIQIVNCDALNDSYKIVPYRSSYKIKPI